MGYYTTAHGSLVIEPPLNNKELSAHPEWWGDSWSELFIDVEEHHVETDEGLLLKREGVGISAPEDEHKAYYTEEILAQMVKAYPEHEFMGHIDFYGEDSTDIWRLKVDNGKVIRIEAEIRWPDTNEVVKSNY